MSGRQFIVGETFRDYYQIKCEKKDYSRVLAPNTVARLLNGQQATVSALKEENEQLKEQLFECRKDYLTETADISDIPYLEDEIIEIKKEIYGDGV